MKALQTDSRMAGRSDGRTDGRSYVEMQERAPNDIIYIRARLMCAIDIRLPMGAKGSDIT